MVHYTLFRTVRSVLSLSPSLSHTTLFNVVIFPNHAINFSATALLDYSVSLIRLIMIGENKKLTESDGGPLGVEDKFVESDDSGEVEGCEKSYVAPDNLPFVRNLEDEGDEE